MSEEQSSDEQFVIHVNKAMAKGLQDGADPDAMARVCLNTAKELYDHYGAGVDHDSYLEFVTDAQFEMAEIEKMLDDIEESESNDD